MKLFPQWIDKEHKEGTDAAAQKKTYWTAIPAWSAIIVAVLILVTVFRGENASGLDKFLSWVTCLATVYAVWKYPDFETQGYWTVIFGGIILMIALAIGFN